jgi:UDP-N-acetylmuramoyl-L-alanyl-D-glutamate--2,6-diaminopimelate ligase
MTLKEVAQTLGIDRFAGEDRPVRRIVTDSREVQPGDLFVALRGTRFDGHRFVDEAVRRGAVACVVEDAVELSVPCFPVADSARALAELSATYHGRPADRLWLCGVTGTNGKTSTTWILRSMLEKAGWGKVGSVGTLGYGTSEWWEKGIHTTPDAPRLQALLARFLEEGCRGVVMEVSSHAVRQRRTWGMEFEVGVLTNVTRDHLDFHGTLEDYRAAKEEFCRSLLDEGRRKGPGTLVYCADDPEARRIGDAFAGPKVRFGTGETAEVRASRLEVSLEATRFLLRLAGGAELPVRLPLLGQFSVLNALAAAAVAEVIGIAPEAIREGLQTVDPVPGRFEAYGGCDRPRVVVDYCHTPDSMDRLLRFCRELAPGRLWVVFGCGGDRDRGKRPLMGRVALRWADRVILTTDNPRHEDPRDIVEDILRGMEDPGDRVWIELDRARAIREAVGEARPGDLVVLCGKGHETYQIVGDERLPFDDREEARRALERWQP